MKKLLAVLLILSMLTATNVSAFELQSICPDNSFIMQHDYEGDKAYIENIANAYSDRFIVERNDNCNISAIDTYFNNLSKMLTREQLDNSVINVSNDFIFDEELKRQFNSFGTFGGFAGYSAEFEPLACYNIYRDISIVGGYIRYYKTILSPDESYWKCISEIQSLTMEVVNYDTRMKILDKINSLNEFIDNDNSFYIFILKDGKINSLWKRSDG